MIEAEQQVIGAVLKKPSLMQEIFLSPADFSTEPHQEVWGCLLDHLSQSRAIEMLTVADTLEQSTGRSDWVGVLAGAMAGCVSPGNGKEYAKLVQDGAKTRKLQEIAAKLETTKRGEWRDNMDYAMRELMELGKENRRWECGIKDALTMAVDEIETAFQSEGMIGLPTGLKDLDHTLGGFHKSDLYIVGARPAMGKTALMLHFAQAPDIPVGIISAEQPRNQMAKRLISATGKVHANRLRNADLEDHEWPRITSAVSQLANKHIRILDQPAPSIYDVIRQGRAWAYNGVQAIYVDYIQRIKAGNRSAPKHEQVGEVVMGLKELARELDIPIIALAQVNREVEKREDRRPRMSDLKDSGTIEQEADNVMTLYRDEVYNEDSPEKGIAEIDVVKNRHGPTGFVKVAWQGAFIKFDDLTHNVIDMQGYN